MIKRIFLIFLKNRKALTFIEVNFVVILIAVLSFAIYGSLSSGLKVWKKTIGTSSFIDAHILFDKITGDLRNAMNFEMIKPSGTGNGLSFACFQTPSSTQGSAGFGEVRYFFNPSGGVIYRQYRDFASILKQDITQKPVAIAKDINSFSISYYSFNKSTNTGAWESNIDASMPDAVKVEVSFLEGTKPVTLTKIMPVIIDSERIF